MSDQTQDAAAPVPNAVEPVVPKAAVSATKPAPKAKAAPKAKEPALTAVVTPAADRSIKGRVEVRGPTAGRWRGRFGTARHFMAEPTIFEPGDLTQDEIDELIEDPELAVTFLAAPKGQTA